MSELIRLATLLEASPALSQAPSDQDRLQLRTEGAAVRCERVLERLDTQPVACQQQAAAAGVPEREREHPPQACQAVEAVVLIEMDDDLDVRLADEAVAAGE